MLIEQLDGSMNIYLMNYELRTDLVYIKNFKEQNKNSDTVRTIYVISCRIIYK